MKWLAVCLALGGIVLLPGSRLVAEVGPDGVSTSTPSAGRGIPRAQGDPRAVIADAPVIDDGGVLRQSGLALVTLDGTTDVNVLAQLADGIELVSDATSAMPAFHGATVRMPDEELTDFLAKASNVSGVLDATPSYLRPLDTFDALWPAQQSTGLNLVDLDSFWGLLGRGAYGVQVAVMDSGVNVNNDLSGSVMAGRNFIPGDPLDDTHDDLGHGTAVSSIIAAHSDNGFGISGIAPGVRIVPIKACDAWGPSMFPACSDAAIKDGLDWVMSEVLSGRQIRVLNMSLGGPSPVFGADFFLQTLHDLGVFEVASAGNDGLAPIVWPGGVNT